MARPLANRAAATCALGLAFFFLMATSLPSLVKTWQFSANAAVTAATTPDLHRGWTLAAKNALKGFSLSPWTVVGSANNASAGLDGTDRWTSAAVMTSGCWIVLKQTGIGPNFQLCWKSSDTGSSGRTDMWISPSNGFTGGLIGTRPTATDEVLITDYASVGWEDTPGISASTTVYVNAAVSTDGQNTRLWGFTNRPVPATAANFHWTIIDRLYEPIAELTFPWVALSRSKGHTANAAAYPGWATSTGALFGRHGTTNLEYGLVFSASGGGGSVGQTAGVGTGLNSLSGDYVLQPVAAVCYTASHRGVHGTIADLWLGSSLVLSGDTYPEASHVGLLDQFVHIGDCAVHPWNNTEPLLGFGSRTRRQGRVVYHHQTLSEASTTMAIIHTAGFGGSTGAELATASPVYTSGDVWFVHGTNGTDAGGTAGKSREAPLASLAQAQTNAAAGDVIVMLSGHTETLSSKLTLSKAGLILLGEGQGANQPSFKRSADVNLWDITGAGIRVENVRFLTDDASGYTSDRVLISANTCLLRGCYFASSANDSASPSLAVANGITNVTIDGGTYFVSSGTSKTATGYQALSFKGTATDVELRDVVFDAGSYGWLSNTVAATGAITRLRAKDVDLLNGSDVILASSTTGYIHVRAESGAARIVWP